MNATKRSKTAQPQVAKIPVVSISLTRAEGPIDLCGTVTIKPISGGNVWKLGDRILQGWALTAPDSGGYDKCDFTIRYADGETYEGRFDLTRAHATQTGTLLQDHLYRAAMWAAGLEKPTWMTDAQYQQRLDADERFIPGFRQRMVTFLQTYAIRD